MRFNKDSFEILEYSNVLLFWILTNIEGNKNLNDNPNSKSNLLICVDNCAGAIEKAKKSSNTQEFLKNIKAYITDLNTLFDVTNEESNKIVSIILSALVIRFNKLSIESDYKEIFVKSSGKNDSAYKLKAYRSTESQEDLKFEAEDNTGWKKFKSEEQKRLNSEYPYEIIAKILSNAIWAIQNTTFAIFIQSALVVTNLMNPVYASIIGFSICFSLLSYSYEFIYNNIRYFMVNLDLINSLQKNLKDPLGSLQKLFLIACSISSASTIVCLTNTMPAFLSRFNLTIGIISAISYSIFFYQDLKKQLTLKNLEDKFKSTYHTLVRVPLEKDNHFTKIFHLTFNLSLLLAGSYGVYITGKEILSNSASFLISNNFLHSTLGFSLLAQKLFLLTSTLGLGAIATSHIYLQFKSILRFLKAVFNSKNIPSEAYQNSDNQPNTSSEFDNVKKPTKITSTKLKEEINNNIKAIYKDKTNFLNKFFKYHFDSQFIHYIAQNLTPEDHCNVTLASRVLIKNIQPHSAFALLNVLKIFIEKFFDPGPIEKDLFDALKFKT